MNVNNDILTFMDILDLGEEIVDNKLKSLMVTNKFTNKNLTETLNLLNYKYLVNIQEDTECDNEDEFDFVVKLIKNADENTTDNICNIIEIVLLLNKTSVVSKCEHLLQQLLVDLFLSNENEEPDKSLMIKLRMSCSILHVIGQIGEKITLLFVDTPLEKIIDLKDEKLKIYFLNNIVPKLMESTTGYNILDRIWNHIKNFENNKKLETLKIISCLSDFYLPVSDKTENLLFESAITNEYEFWDTIIFGLRTNDVSFRKISIYLAKRAIENVAMQNRNVKVVLNTDIIFVWDSKNTNNLKSQWEHYFILIESLEEQQSNIVLPSLQLFGVLNDFGHKWLACAFNIGLKHDNSQVKLKCIEKRLKIGFEDCNQAQIFLEAINDINIYELQDNNVIKHKLLDICKTRQNFLSILKTIPCIKWSPGPLYLISDVLANLKEDYSSILKDNGVLQILKDIIKMPCNNVPVRKAVHINISHCIGNCFKSIDWETYATVYALFKFPKEIINENPLVNLLKNIIILDNDKQKFFACITKSNKNIEIGLLYLNYHGDLNVFIELINEMITNIQTIITKHYSDKLNVYKDVLYLLELHAKTKDSNNIVEDVIYKTITREIKTILQYIPSLFCNDRTLAIEDIHMLFKTIDITAVNEKEMILELYKTSVLFIKNEDTELDKKILAIFAISTLHEAPILNTYYKHELLDIKTLIGTKIDFHDTDQNSGRLRNAYYEKTCEIVYKCLLEEIPSDVKPLKDYIETVTECGGYGCLKWILRIVNKIFINLLNNEDFDMKLFLNRMWNEIEELKSNNQYNICIKEFTILLTQDALLQKPEYNNITLSYCNKIIDYGQLKNTPLFYLTKELSHKDLECYGQLVYVLCDILLYCPVLKRDQRIADSVAQEILKNPKYGININDITIHFNYEIQYISLTILSKIRDSETMGTIVEFLIKRIDNMFKTKQRYHGNSQTHRTLLIVLQHLIMILLLNWERKLIKNAAEWCMEFLGKLPHQPSVRICLEWYIALYYYLENTEVNGNIIELFASRNVPLISQFYILYWLSMHKARNQTLSLEEYEFVLDTLLSHTMGQMFNIRLHAQYMASKLYDLNKNNVNSSKYDYVMEVIKNTFEDSQKDKTFFKLKEDYFANDFEIVNDVNPAFIYYYLPIYCGLPDENVDVDYVKSKLKVICDNINKSKSTDDRFTKQWISSGKYFDSYDMQSRINVDNKTEEDVNEVRTIQKKYIPWKNMSDVNAYNVDKKKQTSSELIVVASLIDKLPNLGGMARTGEVFGVKTYVVDSLRHLQDRQFQGLSVSAERWIDVEEVRPGRPLKDYIAKKKTEGYSIVAAEQTSTSCKLQSFRFPKRTLLLLGHEKEGVPCDLLPLMDHCVEIPQQGFVRSLNVHVTAAIFIWEYSRQNIL